MTQLKRRADKEFSKYIRERDEGVCYTCGVKKPIAQMQAGHFVTRACHALRWDERNVHCQCFRCNIPLKGNLDTYAFKLTQEYGPKILEEFQREKNVIFKINRFFLENLIKIYKNKREALD